MRQFAEYDNANRRDRALRTVLLFAFGCAVLGFFVSIDRVDWLAIRPATGTSLALSAARSDPSAAPQVQAAEEGEARR